MRFQTFPMVLLLALAGCETTVKVTSLVSLDPIRTQFNADAGKPRLIALLSPT